MPQVRNSIDADRNRDYFSTMPVLTMTSGEGKQFWRRFDAISQKRIWEWPKCNWRLRFPSASHNPSLGSTKTIDARPRSGLLVEHRRIRGHGGRRGGGRQHSIEYANDLPDIDEGGVRDINEIAIGHAELLLDEEAVRISQIEPVNDRDLVSPRRKRRVQLEFSRDRGIFVPEDEHALRIRTIVLESPRLGQGLREADSVGVERDLGVHARRANSKESLGIANQREHVVGLHEYVFARVGYDAGQGDARGGSTPRP